jgi:hypothetical protein
MIRAGGMAEMSEHLPSKCEALIQTLLLPLQKKRKKERKRKR